MRLRRIATALAVLPFALSGCGSGTPTASASATPAPGAPWLRVASGSVTPSPVVTFSGSVKPALPSASFLPTSSACAIPWADDIGQVLIPMVVTIGTASLTVQWPNKYGNTYRVTAVPQRLVSGTQPPPTWQTVTTGSACTASATISGLISGAPYIVWLDAPNTPHALDGSRSLYSGKSRVVIPN